MPPHWKALLPTALTLLPNASCQINQDSVVTGLASDALTYLDVLVSDADGNPNPRVTCTEGYRYAAMYVADQMEKMGLEKKGDEDGTTFVHSVPESVHDTICPHGLMNVVGMVRGTELPDEVIVYSAHLDGPNLGNPELQMPYGNLDTTDPYDNGLAVALGLAIANNLVSNPPKRSVLFIFDDAEEGWDMLGTPKVGESYVWDTCFRNRREGDCTDDELAYYDTLFPATCPESLCDIMAEPLEGKTYYGYPIGMNAWTRNPTVDANSIKLAIFGESLGPPPGNGGAYMQVTGGSSIAYGLQGETGSHFLDTIWPEESSFSFLRNPSIKGGAYSSLTSFTDYYEGLCNENCVAAGGIPSLTFTTLSQQRYHGGADYRLAGLQGMFQALTAAYPDLGAELDGVYPSPAYYSIDSMGTMDWERLDELSKTLERVIINAANSENVDKLAYSQEGLYDELESGVSNLEVTRSKILADLSSTSEKFQATMAPIIEDIFEKQGALLVKGLDMTDEEYVEVMGLASMVGQLVTFLDFFNEKYPTKRAFSDKYQGFETSVWDHLAEDYETYQNSGSPKPISDDKDEQADIPYVDLRPASGPSSGCHIPLPKPILAICGVVLLLF